MPYALPSDLVPLRLTSDELVQLTDDTGSGKANLDIVTAALEEASGTVDSYCRTRYNTPLQQSDVVTARTLDITTYLLFTRRRSLKAQGMETIRQRYDDAIAFLVNVSKGVIQLDQPATATASQSSAGGPAISQIPKIFSDDNFRGFN